MIMGVCADEAAFPLNGDGLDCGRCPCELDTLFVNLYSRPMTGVLIVALIIAALWADRRVIGNLDIPQGLPGLP